MPSAYCFSVMSFVLEVRMMDNILRLGQDPSFYPFICTYTTLPTHQVYLGVFF